MIRRGFLVLGPVVAALFVACGTGGGGGKDYGNFEEVEEELPSGDLQVSFVSPTADTVISGIVDLTIQVADPAGGEVKVTLVVDPGKNQVAAGDTTMRAGGYTWVASVDTTALQLKDGKRTFQVTAEATDGRTAVAKLTLVLDNLPPTITLTAPLDGTNVQADFVVTGKVTDPGTAVKAVRLLADGAVVGSWPATGTGALASVAVSFPVSTVGWAIGDHALRLEAEDNLDHSQGFDWKVRYFPGASFETTPSAEFEAKFVATSIQAVAIGVPGEDGSKSGLLALGASGAKVFVRDPSSIAPKALVDVLTGTVSRAVVADLNGDDLEDVVAFVPALGTAKGYVTWRLQAAGAKFPKPAKEPTLALPGSAINVKAITLADLDGNGLPDLLVVVDDPVYSTGIALAKEDAEGAFAGFGEFSSLAGTDNPSWIVVGTFAGTENPAILVGREGAPTVTAFPTDGKGHVSGGVNTFLGKDLNGLGAAVGVNLSKSGVLKMPDRVVVADVSANALVLVSSGALQGIVEVTTRLPTGLQPSRVATADLDGNGFVDLVVLDKGSNAVHVLRGSAESPWLASDTVTLVGPSMDLALVDWDGDDLLDIVALRSDGSGIAVARQEGKRFLGPPVNLCLATTNEGQKAFTPSSVLAGRFTLPPANTPTAPNNLKARSVAVMGVEFGLAQVFATSPITGLPQVPALPTMDVQSFLKQPKGLVAARLDTLVPTDATALDGFLVTSQHVAPPAGPDIETATLAAVRMKAGEAYNAVASAYNRFWAGDLPTLAATGEFTTGLGDGDLFDVVAVSQFAPAKVGEPQVVRLQVFPGLPGGGFQSDPKQLTQSSVQFAEGARPAALIAAPLRMPLSSQKNPANPPKWYDAVVAVPDLGAFSVYFTNGAGDFLDPATNSKFFAVGRGARDVVAGFLDISVAEKSPAGADKHLLDIVTVTEDEVMVSFSADNGSLIKATDALKLNFAAPFALPKGGHMPVMAKIADVNADGFNDILVLDQADSKVLVYVNKGQRTFDDPVVLDVGVGPVALDVADLDGDGCPDIVTSDAAGKTLTILRNLVKCQ